MKILLDLSKHCIETEAKRIYEESLKLYFKAPDSKRPGLEEKIEGLRNFLEHSDFNHLRSSNPVFAGREGGKAVLHLLGGDLFEIEIDGTLYKPKGKDRRQS
ncbi:MAG: hypothetical protein BWK74_02505 [Desulfobacteraceae bacterium A6]|nr:MAG: hypothetical protein BWK74_02505 [Desulfobacteraceae bacterium A6]